jgi:hypothetical protein
MSQIADSAEMGAFLGNQRSSMRLHKRLKRKLDLLRCAKNPAGNSVHIRCSFDNLGDIMVAQAIDTMLSPLQMVTIGPSTAIRYLDRVWPLKKMFSYSCLGGGTLIFAPAGIGWLESTTYFCKRTEGLCTFGTGVIDPAFRAHLNESQSDTFVVDTTTQNAWVAQLKKFRFVSVRGIESQRLLNEAGLTGVEVIGDPALFFADPKLRPRDGNRRHIGINISIYSDFWGDSQELVVSELSKTIQQLHARGFSITLFPTQPADEALAQQILRQLCIPEIAVSACFTSPREFLAEMRDMDLFIGTKLHSVVCAFCVYTPAIMVGYQPKCYDFMKTMGFEKHFIRSDRVSADAVIDLVDAMLVDLPGIRQEQWTVVQTYRERMLDFRTRVLASIGMSPV